MRKIFQLSFANIRKTKGHTVSILLMFIIAAMLLNLGLLVLVNFGSYFEKITKELNASQTYYVMKDRLYSNGVKAYIKNKENVKEFQRENPIMVKGTIPYNKDTREFVFLFSDSDHHRTISKWKFVGEHLSPDGMSVYLPNIMHIDGGYELNDKFKVKSRDVDMTFTVKGFTEDVFFSSLDTVVMGVYMPHDTYERVERKLGDQFKASLIFANLEKKNEYVTNGIKDITRSENPNAGIDDASTFFSLNLNVIKLSRTAMAGGVSVMMVIFAAVIAMVCLIVVRFRIGNSIEEDMTKIGSLKAVGYTSRQIIASIVLQFSSIAFLGSVAGVVLSYSSIPALSTVFSHQSGLVWEQGFDSATSCISILLILFFVTFVSFFASRQIHKLSPIVALRGGIITHSFQRNHMPLHQSMGSLSFVLALKSMLQNKKQSIMLGVIFMVVSFASTFALVMFYNSTIDTRTFAEVPGVELSNVIAVFNPMKNQTAILEDIKQNKDVRKAHFLDITMIKTGNEAVAAYVMNDYSKKETNTIYEGRYPLHSNETSISGYLAKTLNKRIGDSILLRYDKQQVEYIVTGYTQGSYNGGQSIISLTYDGLLKMNPNYKQQDLQIYLKDGVTSSKFKQMLDKHYGNELVITIDMEKEFMEGMRLYSSILSKVGAAIMMVTVLVVIIVVYFVINSSIMRKRHELGIQKALGFTTLQLMNQLSLSFLPPIGIGVLLGSLLGMSQMNPMMTLAQQGMGVMRANYIIAPDWIALFGVGIVIVSYTFSMLITYQIRKISAYRLVSE